MTTHDTGGISSKVRYNIGLQTWKDAHRVYRHALKKCFFENIQDIEMARRMDEYASALLPFQIPEEPVEVPLSEVVVEKTTSSK